MIVSVRASEWREIQLLPLQGATLLIKVIYLLTFKVKVISQNKTMHSQRTKPKQHTVFGSTTAVTHLKSLNRQLLINLTCGRKPEYVREAHQTWEKRGEPSNPGTFALWGAAAQPSGPHVNNRQLRKCSHRTLRARCLHTRVRGDIDWSLSNTSKAPRP